MSAADLRLGTVFGLRPVISSFYLEHGYPRAGEHRVREVVIDWKALASWEDGGFFSGPCLCIRCALHRYHLQEGDCKSRTIAEDMALMKFTYDSINKPDWKRETVLYEAAFRFRYFEMDFGRMLREPARSTVRMYFTVLQTFDLLLFFNEELRARYVKGVFINDRIREEALKDLVRQLEDGSL